MKSWKVRSRIRRNARYRSIIAIERKRAVQIALQEARDPTNGKAVRTNALTIAARIGNMH